MYKVEKVVVAVLSLCFSRRRYLALCFGEVRVRMDLRKAPGPQSPAFKAPAQEDAEQSKVLSLGPSLLRLLNQVGALWLHLAFLRGVQTPEQMKPSDLGCMC